MSGKGHELSAERLAALAAAYGADPARWPADERDAAVRLADGVAQPAPTPDMAEAARIDRLLDAAPTPPQPAAALAGRILAEAPQPKGARLRLAFGAVWRPVTGLAVAAMLGVLVGAVAPAPVVDTGAGNGTSADSEIAALITGTSLDLDAPGDAQP
jgi:hypothetical protein